MFSKTGPIKSVNEGVKRLLNIAEMPIPDFEIVKKGENNLTDYLIMGNLEIPVSYQIYEPRIDTIRSYASDSADDICCVNVYSFTGCDVTLEELIYQELDIAEHILLDRICKVTAFINGGACNIIAKTKKGRLANLELGNTMAYGAQAQFSHRLITKSGIATDRTVNTMVEQSGVYLFSSNDLRPTTFDDGEYYLYGLTPQESNKAVYITAIINGKIKPSEAIERDLHIKTLLSAVKKSAKSRKSVYLSKEGEE